MGTLQSSHDRENPVNTAAPVTLLEALAASPLAQDLNPEQLPVLAARKEEELRAYGEREDVMRFAEEAAQRLGADPAWARDALARARYVPAVARLIMPPPAGTAKNWAAYRSRFVEPVRIRAGLAFWQDFFR